METTVLALTGVAGLATVAVAMWSGRTDPKITDANTDSDPVVPPTITARSAYINRMTGLNKQADAESNNRAKYKLYGDLLAAIKGVNYQMTPADLTQQQKNIIIVTNKRQQCFLQELKAVQASLDALQEADTHYKKFLEFEDFFQDYNQLPEMIALKNKVLLFVMKKFSDAEDGDYSVISDITQFLQKYAGKLPTDKEAILQKQLQYYTCLKEIDESDEAYDTDKDELKRAQTLKAIYIKYKMHINDTDAARMLQHIISPPAAETGDRIENSDLVDIVAVIKSFQNKLQEETSHFNETHGEQVKAALTKCYNLMAEHIIAHWNSMPKKSAANQAEFVIGNKETLEATQTAVRLLAPSHVFTTTDATAMLQAKFTPSPEVVGTAGPKGKYQSIQDAINNIEDINTFMVEIDADINTWYSTLDDDIMPIIQVAINKYITAPGNKVKTPSFVKLCSVELLKLIDTELEIENTQSLDNLMTDAIASGSDDKPLLDAINGMITRFKKEVSDPLPDYEDGGVTKTPCVDKFEKYYASKFSPPKPLRIDVPPSKGATSVSPSPTSSGIFFTPHPIPSHPSPPLAPSSRSLPSISPVPPAASAPSRHPARSVSLPPDSGSATVSRGVAPLP